MFGELSSLFGGGLSASSASRAATGDIGVTLAPSLNTYSPFAVGAGATATATGPTQSNTLVTLATISAVAFVAWQLEKALTK